MIMCYQTKFGSKGISSSKDKLKLSYFDPISSSSDPDSENSKSIFLHDTLAHNDAPHYQV